MKTPSAAERHSILDANRRLKMARSAHAYVRGNTAKFYEWLEASPVAARVGLVRQSAFDVGKSLVHPIGVRAVDGAVHGLKMIAALPATEPAIVLRQIGTRLVGLELDPFAAGFGQNAVELLLADVTAAAGRPAPTVVRVADTLEEAPAARFDLVIGNPPYGRVTLNRRACSLAVVRWTRTHASSTSSQASPRSILK